MKTFSRGGVPMLQVSVSVSCNQYVCCLHCWCLRSPSDGSNRHIIWHSILVEGAAKSESALGCLSVVHSDCAISKSCGQILVCGVESARENLRLRITQSHLVSVSTTCSFLVKNFLSFLWWLSSGLSDLLKGWWHLWIHFWFLFYDEL
jgi:hypothetical protein